LVGDIEAATSSRIEEMVQELTQPEGVEASVAEITPERATTEIGEPSTLPEEEATTEAGEALTLQGEEATIEARETSALREEAPAEVGETSVLQDSPKDSTPLGFQQGNEVLMTQMFLSSLYLMLRYFAERTEGTQVEELTVSAPPEGHTAPVLVEVSEEVRLTTPSSAVEVPAGIAPSEAPEATLALAVSAVSTTLVREDPPYIPYPVIKRGSGSTSGDDAMEFLTCKTVQQFFDSMQDCIDLILSGHSSFGFARRFLKNMIENLELMGGPSLAKSCLLLVEQLGSDLEELKSLEDGGSFHEAQVTLTRLLAAQAQE